MTRLDLGTIERIALEFAPSPCEILEDLRQEIERQGPLGRGFLEGYCHCFPPGEEAFVNALFAHLSNPPDRRKRSRRSTDLDAERKSVELVTKLGESIGDIFGEAMGQVFGETLTNTEALNRKIAAHEPRAGEGRTDD